jgi:hypothetical protein
MMAKKYMTLRFNTRGSPGVDLAQKYKCVTCSVAILTPDGEVAARYLDHPSGAHVAEGIVGVPEVAAGEEQLAQLKAKGVTKANAESVAAALKKIGTLTSDKARDTILEYAKDDNAPEGVQRGAILALAKQPAAAKDLVGYLTDKRYPIKSAAQTTLVAMGPPGLPGVLDGLESDNADARVAVFSVATAVTKNGKVSKDVTFWKSGKPDDRAKALSDWKAWAEAHAKPKDKDEPAKKK